MIPFLRESDPQFAHAQPRGLACAVIHGLHILLDVPGYNTVALMYFSEVATRGAKSDFVNRI